MAKSSSERSGSPGERTHGPTDIHEHAAEQSGVGQDYANSAMTDRADHVAPGVTTSEAAAGKKEEVIPLAEEELQVGKRTVDRGATTIRRYVVHRPVEEQVTLRDETVSVERPRPVTPGEAGVPAGAFEERTVEVHQTAEEPVVSKTRTLPKKLSSTRRALSAGKRCATTFVGKRSKFRIRLAQRHNIWHGRDLIPGHRPGNRVQNGSALA
jgi:hypothetical protein